MPHSIEPVGTDLLRIDDELSDEERLVRDTVRKFAADRIMPYIADWFSANSVCWACISRDTAAPAWVPLPTA